MTENTQQKQPKAQKLVGVKGMNDILPPDSARWEWLEGQVRELMARLLQLAVRGVDRVAALRVALDCLADVTHVIEEQRVSDNRAAELLRALELTPFARTCFEESYLPTDCPVEAARRLVVRGFFGEIISKIAVEAIRDRLASRPGAKLVEHTAWPSLFACPNLVLRGEDGLQYGVSDVMSPWSGAASEDDA